MRHRPLVILGVAFIAGIGAWLGGIHSLVAVLTVAVAGLGLLMTGGRHCGRHISRSSRHRMCRTGTAASRPCIWSGPSSPTPMSGMGA
jgi:UPF0716 family protein affecting phage T7 exclusion